MLTALTESVSAAVISVDAQGNVGEVFFSRRPNYPGRVRGKSFSRLLWRLFGPAAAAINNAYLNARATGQVVQLPRVEHKTLRKQTEYHRWTFCPGAPDGGMTVCALDATEDVCLEEEFAVLARQNETANRELLAAMSTLDFRLMDLDQAHKKLAALYRITSVVQRTVDEREVLAEIVAGITGELGYACAAVLLVDEERRELVMRACHGGYPGNIRIPYGKGVTWQAVQNRQMVYVPDVTKEPRYIPATGYGVSEVAVPLIYADKVLGVLDVETSEERPLTPYDRDLLGSLAGQVALTIVHAQHVAKMELQAITDGLTGLYNYRYFLDVLGRELKRAARYKRPLALLMLDIDSFKHYNDTNGHGLGNEVLRQIAAIMRSLCRDVDYIARYGGEEFVILFPETSLPEAAAAAERIRAAVAAHPFVGRDTQPGGVLSVSIGVAGYPEGAASDRELIDHADAALYLAKRTTKNCVVVYQEPQKKREKRPRPFRR